jgi:hypothetical protein
MTDSSTKLSEVVEAMGLKIIASRFPSMAWPAYQIS